MILWEHGKNPGLLSFQGINFEIHCVLSGNGVPTFYSILVASWIVWIFNIGRIEVK